MALSIRNFMVTGEKLSLSAGVPPAIGVQLLRVGADAERRADTARREESARLEADRLVRTGAVEIVPLPPPTELDLRLRRIKTSLYASVASSSRVGVYEEVINRICEALGARNYDHALELAVDLASERHSGRGPITSLFIPFEQSGQFIIDKVEQYIARARTTYL